MNFSLRDSVSVLLKLSASGILLYSSYAKFLDVTAFTDTLSHYRYIPDALEVPLAFLMPLLELIIGVLIWLPSLTALISWAYLVLMASFIGLIALNYGELMPNGCGCFGVTEPTVIGWKELARDSLFVVPGIGLLLIHYYWHPNKEHSASVADESAL